MPCLVRVLARVLKCLLGFELVTLADPLYWSILNEKGSNDIAEQEVAYMHEEQQAHH